MRTIAPFIVFLCAIIGTTQGAEINPSDLTVSRVAWEKIFKDALGNDPTSPLATALISAQVAILTKEAAEPFLKKWQAFERAAKAGEKPGNWEAIERALKAGENPKTVLLSPSEKVATLSAELKVNLLEWYSLSLKDDPKDAMRAYWLRERVRNLQERRKLVANYGETVIEKSWQNLIQTAVLFGQPRVELDLGK